MANPRRYLLPSERLAAEVRRHWAVVAADTLQSLALLVVGLVIAQFGSGSEFVRTLVVYFCIFVIFRWIWIVWDWMVEKLVITDKRVLLVTGIVSRKVAIMPLVKVTDLTYNRSAMGLLLGYGEFVVETAGQDQALSRINYIPRPEKLYMQISELLFGGDKGSPGVLASPAERDAELAAGRRLLRGARRGFGWRRRRAGASRPGMREEPAPTGRLDDLLTHRDTLLADRDDPIDGDREFRTDDTYVDDRFDDDDEYRPGDDYDRGDTPTGEMPPIHEPGRSGGRLGSVRSDRPPRDLRGDRVDPPRPRPSEPPTGPQQDPADD